MEGLSKVIVCLVILVSIAKAGHSALHYVGGGKTGWGPNVKLSDWSSHEHFYVGDWLYFGYDRYQYNLLEVNQTSYEKCIETNFITNETGGAGRDVFELKQARTYYFISGKGHCSQGMKLAVNVEADEPVPAPAPAPTPTPTSAESSYLPISYNQIFLPALAAALFWTFSH